MSVISTSSSTSKIRSREGWAHVEEVNRVRLTPSTGLNIFELKQEASGSVTASSVNVSLEDARLEEEHNRGSRGLPHRMDIIEDEEMGFEVEMSLRGYNGSKENASSVGDDSSAGRSSLAFSLSKMSGSECAFDNMKAASDNFKTFSRSHGDGESSIENGNADNANNHSMESSIMPKRGKNLSVDVDAGVSSRHGIRDDTPKTNNRSNRSHRSYSPSRASKLLKSKKKEGVAKTLATVVQHVEDPPSRINPGDDTDDSSAEVDARWEQFSLKFLEEKQYYTESPTTEAHLLHTLLDVNSGSHEFEDDLIQDCLDTGTPSPRKAHESKHEPDIRAISEPPGNISNEITPVEGCDSPTSYPSNLPTLDLRKIHPGETKSTVQTVQEKQELFQEASVESVASALTIDDDTSPLPHQFSDFSEIGEDMCEGTGHGILKAFSSCSDDDPIMQSRSPRDLLQSFQSSDSESGLFPAATPSLQKPAQSPKLLPTPRLATGQQIDELIWTPKIEVALVNSFSDISDNNRDGSEASGSSQRRHTNTKLRQNVAQNRHDESHESTATTSSPDGRLLWWRENGKQLVHEEMNQAQTGMRSEMHHEKTKEGTENHTIVEPSTSKVESCDEGRLLRKNSLFDDSSESKSSASSQAKSKSAFKLGLAIFEKGKLEQTSAKELRKSGEKLTPSNDGSLIKRMLQFQKKEKTGRAPQPNPDAMSSNSRDRDRKRKISTKTGTASSKSRISVAPQKLCTPQRVDPILELGGRVKDKPSESPQKLCTPQSVDPILELGGRVKDKPSEPPQKLCTPQSVDPILELGGRVKDKPSESYVEDISSRTPKATTSRAKAHQSAEQYQCIISGKKRALSGEDNQSKRSGSDESEFDAHIINVSSTLTGGTSDTCASAVDVDEVCSSPILTEAKKSDPEKGSDRVTEMLVGYRSTRSFDTMITASSAGVPSWRMEPAESLADFTIEIICDNTEASSLYHIHKHILAVGPRRSEQLEGVFRSASLSTTSLSLLEDAAALVPSVLDFIYCHDFELHLTTENVVAYRHLAITLKVIPILVKTAEFMLKDLSIGNLSTYVSQSAHFKDETLTSLIAAKCGEEIENIALQDALWTVMDPSVFIRVISCPHIDRCKLSSQLSLLLVVYQRLHRHEMKTKIFQKVIVNSILPIIDREAAIPLLEICEGYGSPVSFQPLQKRCAQVMAYHWKKTNARNRKQLFGLLRSLPSSFTVDFLETVETGKEAALFDATTLNTVEGSKDLKALKQYQSLSTFTLKKLCENRVNGGGEPLGPNKSVPLSWNMEPDLTFSDWTIKVKHRHDSQIDSYNIHKHMLSVGQYKSNFFAEAFLSGEHAHARKGTTIIELAKEPAKLVPLVLDFIYSPDHHISVTTNTASALRFLARVFGIWMLNKRVLEFVNSDMSLSNILFYLERSELYDDERIVNIAIRKCALRVKDIDPDSNLLRGMKPTFFGRVVASTAIDKTASCYINILIAKFFTLNDLDESLLAELMKQVPMKIIDFESALKLLDVMSPVAAKGVAVFGDIRRRCCDVLAENWKELREEKRELAFSILRTLDPALLADLFDAVEDDYYQQHYESMTIQSKLVKRYRSQLSDAKVQREAEIAKVRQEMDERMAKMLEKQQELEIRLKKQNDTTSQQSLSTTCLLGPEKVSAPRRSAMHISRQSLIPRLNPSNRSSQPSPITFTKPTHTLKQDPSIRRSVEAPSPRSSETTDTPQKWEATQSTQLTTQGSGEELVAQTSLFGRMFACGPSDTTEPSDAGISSPMQSIGQRNHYHTHIAQTTVASQ